MSKRSSRKRKIDTLENHSAYIPPAKRIKSNNYNKNNNNNNNNNHLNDHRNKMSYGITNNRSTRRRKKKLTKKMTIKKFKIQPKLSTTYEKDTINKLMNAVSDIHAKRSGNCSFEELYRFCQSLCTLNKGKLIYDSLYAICDKHIASMISNLDPSISASSHTYLEPICLIWDNHRSEMHAIRQVFLMLDRTYVRQSTDIKSLWKMGINLLSAHLNKQKDIIDRIIFNLLLLIKLERNGEEIAKLLIKKIIIMCAHLNLYKNNFEVKLIKSTSLYYKLEGIKLINLYSIPDYLNYVIKRISDENNRCNNYLDITTLKSLTITIEREMIENHIDQILNKGFIGMMDNNLINDLRHLYGLFNNISSNKGLNGLREHFNKYIRAKGLKICIINDKILNNPPVLNEIIPKLLQFKFNLDNIISTCFLSDNSFRIIIRKSWEYFLNFDQFQQNKIAELMAKYIDFQLKHGCRGTSSSELEIQLNGVMNIFRFIHGKDVFCAFYKKDLAKRLLLNTSSSFDAEKNMINRIRKECGQAYAANLENMFADIDISQDLNSKFLNTITNTTNNISFNISVLTSGCWPTYSIDSNLILPSQISSIYSSFNKFYISINNGRKLKFTSALSHCIITGNFPKGKKELVLSIYQALILLLFNNTNRASFNKIFLKTNIPKKELKLNILSLIKSNILLRKNNKMKKLNNITDEKEEFKLNSKYENRLRRIKINQIQIIETKNEIKKTQNKIYRDRQYQIDACIVRIMKARKSLYHQQLMAECLKQLRFDSKPRAIKKRIETLIENEYLSRDNDNKNLYHYKA